MIINLIKYRYFSNSKQKAIITAYLAIFERLTIIIFLVAEETQVF